MYGIIGKYGSFPARDASIIRYKYNFVFVAHRMSNKEQYFVSLAGKFPVVDRSDIIDTLPGNF